MQTDWAGHIKYLSEIWILEIQREGAEIESLCWEQNIRDIVRPQQRGQWKWDWTDPMTQWQERGESEPGWLRTSTPTQPGDTVYALRSRIYYLHQSRFLKNTQTLSYKLSFSFQSFSSVVQWSIVLWLFIWSQWAVLGVMTPLLVSTCYLTSVMMYCGVTLELVLW